MYKLVKVCRKCSEKKSLDQFRFTADKRYKAGGFRKTVCRKCESVSRTQRRKHGD